MKHIIAILLILFFNRSLGQTPLPAIDTAFGSPGLSCPLLYSEEWRRCDSFYKNRIKYIVYNRYETSPCLFGSEIFRGKDTTELRPSDYIIDKILHPEKYKKHL